MSSLVSRAVSGASAIVGRFVGRGSGAAPAGRRRGAPAQRPTRWWLETLRQRRERMYEEKLDLETPIVWESEAEQRAAIAFFNAAFRAEESGLKQAHELASAVATWDPELAECLRLYGDEEGWHRELLTEFLAWLGGEVKPMGKVTGTFYRLYGRAERMDTIVLTNLMFETIGSTTYRLALRRARHPAVRSMLTILTRDESFHVPLNVHFLRELLAHEQKERGLAQALYAKTRLQGLYHLLFVSLLGSAYASRRRALEFDKIPFPVLSKAYAEQLARLFLHEHDLGLRPPSGLLAAMGFRKEDLATRDSAVSIEAAEAAADRTKVQVTAL